MLKISTGDVASAAMGAAGGVADGGSALMRSRPNRTSCWSNRVDFTHWQWFGHCHRRVRLQWPLPSVHESCDQTTQAERGTDRQGHLDAESLTQGADDKGTQWRGAGEQQGIETHHPAAQLGRRRELHASASRGAEDNAGRAQADKQHLGKGE